MRNLEKDRGFRVTSPAQFLLNSEHYQPLQSCIEPSMAFLFRGKLVCFYCGCKSAKTRTPNVRRWQCAHCEAENYLDQVPLFTYPPYDTLADVLHYRMAKSQTLRQTMSHPTLAMHNHLLGKLLQCSRHLTTPCSVQRA